ncbi:MAG: N,N'-diacetylchitobiose phosphorylase [Bacteroidia bacterium]|nr:MAG: N,N'-diacetylchitobiose phosphorylase [Bacteroidia bacterium]
MKYGYFDNKLKEYVITHPSTPASWSNYLGDTRYGAIITNNAGGYSFFRSAVQGRFMRFRSNTIPMDQPGRYIYFHDMVSRESWSASWQPMAKPLDEFESVCRHGTAYSIITSRHRGITSETTYFVPLGQAFEYWLCKLTNHSDKSRKIRAFTFVEHANHWHMYHDMVNLQYSQYILKSRVEDNIIEQGINVNLTLKEQGSANEAAKYSFIGIAGSPVSGFDTDREAFLGRYGDYKSPEVVLQGACKQSMAEGYNGCGVLQTEVGLKPGESKEFTVVLGIGGINDTGKRVLEEACDISLVKNRLKELVQHWHKRLSHFTVESPDSMFNSMMNTWNPYNCLVTFAWSRAASLVYAGERDGYGYRDTVQDLLGVIHILPEEAKKRLELMITGQASTGGAMPVVKFVDHKPGLEKAPEESQYRSDDCMWLFNAIPTYVKETGDINFFNKVLPYADKGEDTVLNHMKKAIMFSLERTGKRGLPCGLLADWNDCLELGHAGESVFVALQLYYALGVYAEITEMLGLEKETNWAKEQQLTLGNNIEAHAWDGRWYLRAYSEKSQVFGSQKNQEGSLWLNPQSWAVISGHADQQRTKQILQAVKDRLSTEYGVMICDPPYVNEELSVIRAVLFNPGMKENGSVFNHTQGWIVMAETLAGNGNRAFEYFRSSMPASYNEKAEIRQIEPYVYSQSTHGKHSPHHGASNLPWLTGAAAWAYYAATQYILGIQPEYEGISINPCIPNAWKKIKIHREFRGKKMNIEIRNPNNNEKGVAKIIINCQEIKGSLIPVNMLKKTNEIIVVLI